MSDETQALAFMAGANSIFYGEQLLTTPNPEVSQDQQLFKRLGLTTLQWEPSEQAVAASAGANDTLFYNAAAG
jgi:biotin synthase